jgi:hypothetical protein
VSRRRSGSGSRAGSGSGAGGIAPVYEGPEVLSLLLSKAGSPHDADAVAAAFQRAHEAGEPRAAVIPTLFPDEPRFDSPDAARRLYSNLFGLWSRVAAGLGPHDDAPAVLDEPPPPPPLPERGLAPGDAVPADVVDATWRHLAAAPPREVQRRRDRFGNVQPDLVAWLEATPLPEPGALAALELAFEAWTTFDLAFGDRLGMVDYRSLRELEREPPAMTEAQPALAAYVDEQLDNLADEETAFGPEERAQVEKALAALVAALTGAVHEPS